MQPLSAQESPLCLAMYLTLPRELRRLMLACLFYQPWLLA